MPTVGVHLDLYAGDAGSYLLFLFNGASPVDAAGDALVEIGNGYFTANVAETLNSIRYKAVVHKDGVIIYTGWMAIDPILSVAVAILILKSAWVLVKRSAHVLLEGAPEWLDIPAMQDDLVEKIPEVASIHHVHVWGLTPQDLMLTMHVTTSVEPRDPTAVVRSVKARLREKYGIGHSTIELETETCADH